MQGQACGMSHCMETELTSWMWELVVSEKGNMEAKRLYVCLVNVCVNHIGVETAKLILQLTFCYLSQGTIDAILDVEVKGVARYTGNERIRSTRVRSKLHIPVTGM